MKLSKILFGMFCGAFAMNANAADVSIYYSPTCPHCHHARDFIENTLIYEYDNLKVSTINVMNTNNRQAFVDALYKCDYKSGGVPVLVVGKKCFQGYSDSMQADLRAAIEVDLSAAQKSAAAANKAALEKDRKAFSDAHSDRKNAVSEKEFVKKK